MKLEELKKIRTGTPHETLFPETPETLESWDCSAFILAHLLDAANVHYTVRGYMGGYQFRFTEGRDAILHYGSYGREDALWETYGFVDDFDDVTGHQTPWDVVNRLHNDMENEQEENND